MRQYKLSEDAVEDLILIHQYGIRNYGETQADKYYHAFFDHFEQIAAQPYLYQAVNHIRQGYRRCVCGSDNIYYRINDKTVEIMNIIGRQEMKY